MFGKIPGSVIKDYREYSRRFWEILLKVPGNFIKDSAECSKRFM